ncbi:hypothetical protein FVE85_6218 [Porphyridium purpureum]|uniref:Uncharacterized protein n=1 Tax=Porphyridium purpureum TaxID=35688 RepID=A0A5J4Z742_PORPP|nr:hypothetical protein FVE85_6218 [Porphyridium purpureum]|eukprot:POR3331..scf295_1
MPKAGRKSGNSSRSVSRYASEDKGEYVNGFDFEEVVTVSRENDDNHFSARSKRRQGSGKLNEKKLRLADELRSPRTPGSARTPRSLGSHVLTGLVAALRLVARYVRTINASRLARVSIGIFVALVVVMQIHSELNLADARFRHPSEPQHVKEADVVPSQVVGGQDLQASAAPALTQGAHRVEEQQQQHEQEGVGKELDSHESAVDKALRAVVEAQEEEAQDPHGGGEAAAFNPKSAPPPTTFLNAQTASTYRRISSEDEIVKLGSQVIRIGAEFLPSVHSDDTQRLAELLGGLIVKHKFVKVVDVSCRLLMPVMTQIQSGLLDQMPLYQYTCIEAGSRAVQALWAKYKKEKDTVGEGMAFLRKDLATPDLKDFPRGNVLIAYDYFQRMDKPRIIEAFRNIKELGFKYLIMTTNPGRKNPVGEQKWKYARMDFAKEPYHLVQPMYTFGNLTVKEECQTCPKLLQMYMITPRLLRHMVSMTKEEEEQDKLSGSGIHKVMDIQS